MGVKGVLQIDSGKSGPVFGITVCTHGNELAGLATVHYLINIYKIKKKLMNGSLIIAVNNLRACKRALDAKNEVGRLKSRYIDMNMNRLPERMVNVNNKNQYEIRRAKSLMPIWKMFDIAIDIHSTIQDNQPMVIARTNLNYGLIKDFPIDILITNIDKVQCGIPPAFGFYGVNKNIQTIGIEAGQHDSKKSHETAIKCVLSMLKKKGMIASKQSGLKYKIFREYRIFDSVVFANRNSRLSRVLRDFETVRKGELLAIADNKNIYAPSDCCIMMAPKGIKPVKIHEEVIFLSMPMIKRIIK